MGYGKTTLSSKLLVFTKSMFYQNKCYCDLGLAKLNKKAQKVKKIEKSLSQFLLQKI